ncbi:phospholipase A [Bordetella bronchiseptica]|uniref:phospholipase A n=1 Tax=Bordetella bronchiseptica TaxID=518 RepID=UPI00081D111C|nr:phospholipase A [Bordetella bronchiseptica]AOB26102.1 phospholipase [Bordetella bronchiseptica]AZW43388.1 phospholipase [Bordetella bronchiseptica]MBN3268824.1 phospholipase [Bordetella bronchiseptica]
MQVPDSRSPFIRPVLAGALALALAGTSLSASAGISYRLDRPAAAPGETVRLEAVFFNDGSASAAWNAPRQLVLQWRGADGQTIRSLAQRPAGEMALNIPVNNFARMSWDAVVPVRARGLQAVSIEGESAMLALDATGRETDTLASTPADVPVTDARTGQPLPPAAVTAAGVSPDSGPAPAQVAVSQTFQPASAFDAFRSAISEYQPMYFDIGTRERTTARFQISAKYRLFSPKGDRPATFGENFYLGYTQTSLWDLEGDSKPFIDTTFNPSAFWLSDNIWSSASQNWRIGLNTGVEHQSNGKSGDDSRSLNDAYVQPALNYRFDSGSTLTFAPKVKTYFGVARENRDYADYAGYVDWNLRWAQDGGAVVSAMYRQGASSRRTTQLDFAWPLKRTWLDMNGYLHLQYFNGYGETLLGYNQRHDSQFRIGLSLVP